MLSDLNARIGNEEVLDVMEKCGVPERNVSGERLLVRDGFRDGNGEG
mgnify:CR=1 FL=1